jgi:hypothetical protein
MSIRWTTMALALAAASCADLPSSTGPMREAASPQQEEIANDIAWERKVFRDHALTPDRAAQQGYREIVRTLRKEGDGVYNRTDVCYTKRSDAELARLRATTDTRNHRALAGLMSPDARNAELCAIDISAASQDVEDASPPRRAKLLASHDKPSTFDTQGFRLTRAERERQLVEQAENAAEFLQVVRSGDLDRISRARDRHRERAAQISEKYGEMMLAASQKFAEARRNAPSGGSDGGGKQAGGAGADDGLPTLSCAEIAPRAEAYVKKRNVPVSCSAYVTALLIKACRAKMIEEGAKPADIDASYNQSLVVAEEFLNGNRFQCEGWPASQIRRRTNRPESPRSGCSTDSPPGTCFR